MILQPAQSLESSVRGRGTSAASPEGGQGSVPSRSGPFAGLSRTLVRLLRNSPLGGLLSRGPGDRQERPLSAAQRLQEAEERSLAQALASGRRATLLAFYSPHCRLCRSLSPAVDQLRQRELPWLSIVSLNATSPSWLPEVSNYSIAYVPCFVLLDSRGRAMAKTGEPFSRPHVLKGLAYLLESLRPMRMPGSSEPSSTLS